MSSKILEFLGLADSKDGDVVVESHRRQRSDYLKKIQRLVVPPEDQDASSPVSGEPRAAAPYVAVKDDPLTEEAPQGAEPQPVPMVERVSGTGEGRRAAARKRESLTDKLRSFGQSLRRPDEKQPTLILIRKNIPAMIEDIEDALVGGQTVLLDFESEDSAVARDVISKVVAFARMHDGVYYTVTSTSLLLALGRNAVVEWLPDESGDRSTENER